MATLTGGAFKTRPSIGDLTLSGDLYEGNFSEWHPRAMASLRQRELDVFATPGFWFSFVGAKTSEQAAAHVCSMTSVALLKRVPDEVRWNCSRLMETLKGLMMPFRFLELPAEVRARVYGLLWPKVFKIAGHDSGRDRLPPVLQVSSQIRQEALPLFYSNTKFSIKIDADEYPLGRDYIERDLLIRWSRSAVAGNAKHLTSLMLWINDGCKIRFKVHNGALSISFEGDYLNKDYAEHANSKLRWHLKCLEPICKAMNMKGEAIIVALLKDWNLWWEIAVGLAVRDPVDSDLDSDTEWNLGDLFW